MRRGHSSNPGRRIASMARASLVPPPDKTVVPEGHSLYVVTLMLRNENGTWKGAGAFGGTRTLFATPETITSKVRELVAHENRDLGGGFVDWGPQPPKVFRVRRVSIESEWFVDVNGKTNI